MSIFRRKFQIMPNNFRGGFRSKNLYKKNGKIPPKNRGCSSDNINSINVLNTSSAECKQTGNVEGVQVQKIFPHEHLRRDKCAYAGWKLYFPNNEYKNSVEIVRKVKIAENFISKYIDSFETEEIEERRACAFDLKLWFSDENVTNTWPSFNDELLHEPLHTLNILGLAVHETVLKIMKEQSTTSQNQPNCEIELPIIKARIMNFNITTPFKNLKTSLYGKLVSISGTVIRVSNTKLQCSWLAFRCNACAELQCVKQPDGAFTNPTRCLNTLCYCRTFKPMRSSSYTQTYDWQSIKLQESVPDDQPDGGRVPRTVECEFTDDLVNSCTPGDVVTVTGIVKVRNIDEKKKGPGMYSLFIEAISVINNKNMEYGSNESSGMMVQFTQRDYDAIQEIHSEKSLFKLLVHSLCPTIYGHEMVKAGLLLALFGGSQSDSNDTRSEAHMLVVGDPGLGKSQMLQACSFKAPRGVFVCGNSTTSSGLTVTLSREGGGDYALEAGALVLADQGCCCIDEFDKMSTQHQALLEVMEQQTVSIAKAGVICMLPARTTVLAAANPAGGHYNKAKTVAENLRLGQALLSRFDLVFILLDKPNEHLDSLLSEHVMNTHLGIKSNNFNASTHSIDLTQCGNNNRNIPLCEALKTNRKESLDLIPASLLRKYIAYAKKYVSNVKLSREACDTLQQFYLKLRLNHHTVDSTPVTTRQLLSLIRLTQARAKLELREEAGVHDALDVIELVNWSLIDTYSDEFGELDFKRSQHGSGISTKSQAKKFLMFLHRKCELDTRSTFSINELKEIAHSAKIDIGDFSSFIATLNAQGFLLKKGKQLYQVLSAD